MNTWRFYQKELCLRELPRVSRRMAVAIIALSTIAARAAHAQTEAPHLLAEAITAPSNSASQVASTGSSVASGVEAPAHEKDDAAQQFVGTCAGCHTVGGGAMRGPDLAGTAAWPEPQLTAAVQSKQRKVGPLTQAQVRGLVRLLKDSVVKERLAKARASLSIDPETKSAPPNALLGGALFFGKTALENGGMACNSCHRFRGEGGDLGPDLSEYATQGEIETVASTISRAGFPVMRAAYQSHPINPNEARHIAAFMKHAKSARRAVAPSTIAGTGIASGFAAFVAAILYIVTRPKGIRSRLAQRAVKR